MFVCAYDSNPNNSTIYEKILNLITRELNLTPWV